MPSCDIATNLKSSEIPNNFEVKTCNFLAATINKPSERIYVNVQSDQRMSNSGETNPTAVVKIWSIGSFNKEFNDKISPSLYHFFEENLKIPVNKILILLYDIPRETFAQRPN